MACVKIIAHDYDSALYSAVPIIITSEIIPSQKNNIQAISNYASGVISQ